MKLDSKLGCLSEAEGMECTCKGFQFQGVSGGGTVSRLSEWTDGRVWAITITITITIINIIRSLSNPPTHLIQTPPHPFGLWLLAKNRRFDRFSPFPTLHFNVTMLPRSSPERP
jgi:hypothetical protein